MRPTSSAASSARSLTGSATWLFAIASCSHRFHVSHCCEALRANEIRPSLTGIHHACKGAATSFVFLLDIQLNSLEVSRCVYGTLQSYICPVGLFKETRLLMAFSPAPQSEGCALEALNRKVVRNITAVLPPVPHCARSTGV